MKLKSYKGRTLQEALLKVKADLGPSALIVRTQTMPAGEGEVEVVAARKTPEQAPQPVGRAEHEHEHGNGEQPDATPPQAKAPTVEKELQSIRSTLETLTHLVSPNLPGQFGKIRSRLQDQGVEPALALSIIEQAMGNLRPAQFTDPVAITESVAAVMASKVAVSGPLNLGDDGCAFVSLVGPTGVGKTTTIAKLSANYTLKEERKVGLITIDTYRVAAVEQLRAFAEMLGIPFQVVFTPSELRSAAEKMANLDLVLIDTVGRSHWDRIRIQELKGFLQGLPQVEPCLVVSAGIKYADAKDVVDNFSAVNPQRFIFTKIDETTSFGSLLNLAAKCQKPVAYMTTGQEVPDDIETAEPRRIAELILGDMVRG